MPTLLELALASPGGRKTRLANDQLSDELDLALAYLERRISGKQFCAVWPGTRQNASSRVGITLARAYKAGLIKRTPHQENS